MTARKKLLVVHAAGLGHAFAVRHGLPGSGLAPEPMDTVFPAVTCPVQASFRRNSNRLVLKCQVPTPGTDVTRTLEAIVTEKFRAVGLESYLHVIRIPRIQDL